MKLNAEENPAESVVTVNIEGSVDTVTASELEEYLSRFYGQFTKMILNFQQVTYISSSGLRVLLRADAAMNGNEGFALKNVNADVREVLELTGFTDLVTILE